MIGERLRLQEYEDRFGDDSAAKALSEVLSESQPPVFVSALVLRQWYTQYHPRSGPLHFDTAAALEESMGAELRLCYGDLDARVLVSSLGRRRKAVLISLKVARTWVSQYGAKQSATGSVAQKRPASCSAEPVLKRPASMSMLQGSSENLHIRK